MLDLEEALYSRAHGLKKILETGYRRDRSMICNLENGMYYSSRKCSAI
jgi:hypothetical protein